MADTVLEYCISVHATEVYWNGWWSNAECSEANSNDGGHSGVGLKIFTHLTPTKSDVS